MPYTEPFKFWHLETPIMLTQVPPIQNQWYDVCDLHDGILGIYFKIYQKNDEVAVKQLEIEITVDNIVFLMTSVTGDDRVTYLNLSNDDFPNIDSGTIIDSGSAKLMGFTQNLEIDAFDEEILAEYLYCHDLKIRVRMLSLVGGNQTMGECLWYERLEPI